ncbi:vomeronasal type-2 receptor 1-like [Dendropsophus ebraccatus]|uniref:vomeronasal type-2 receptor 1-like n=1 Tax=Dendropsophus ebraccatus TaxID=150705 RepID=UPI0038310D5A
MVKPRGKGRGRRLGVTRDAVGRGPDSGQDDTAAPIEEVAVAHRRHSFPSFFSQLTGSQGTPLLKPQQCEQVITWIADKVSSTYLPPSLQRSPPTLAKVMEPLLQKVSLLPYRLAPPGKGGIQIYHHAPKNPFLDPSLSQSNRSSRSVPMPKLCSSRETKKYKIVHHITCTTERVIYQASCPCGLMYIGMTSRQLKTRTLEHVRDIKRTKQMNTSNIWEVEQLKPIPRHFLTEHNSDHRGLKVRGIDQINLGIRGGDVTRRLLQVESKWMTVLNTVQPGGLNERLSFACFLFGLESYQMLHTLMFTIEEVNNDPFILSNVTLGFQMYDTCNIPQYELQGALQFLIDTSITVTNNQCQSSSSFPAAIGSYSSANSIILAHFLGTFRYPQVSPLSSVSLLSNRKIFPSFFRIAANDKFQSIGLANFVLSFGWTWVGLLASNNDYGLEGINPIRQELIKAGACLAFTEYIRLGQPDRNAPRIVRTIKESTARVVVVFALDVDFLPVVNELMKQNVTERIFVGNAGWARSIILSTSNYFQVLKGALGIATYGYVVPGLNQFLKNIRPRASMEPNWAKQYWEKLFSCTFPNGDNTVKTVKNCTGLEQLEEVIDSSTFSNSLRYTHHLYASVRTLAKALNDLKNCKSGGGPFSNGTCANIWNFKPWQLTYYIRKVRMTLNTGKEIYFDENGDLPYIYRIVNWQMNLDGTVTQVNIGTFSTSEPFNKALILNTSLITWPTGGKQVPHSVCSESCTLGYRKAAIQGQPICCFECVSCLQGEITNHTGSINCIRCPWDQWPNREKSNCLPKPTEFLSYEDVLGATLAASSLISSIVPFLLLRLFIKHRMTPIVKASNYSLSCLLLLSLCLCFYCSLVFIGYPERYKCLLRQVTFGLVFTLCVACILAKTIMVVLAFMATKPGSSLRRWTTFRVSYMIIFICCLLQLILCLTWLSITPPYAQYNTYIRPEMIIVDCNEGSPIAFWTMMGYLFLLATISFIVAFLARRLPDSFNEAQYITFSMLAFLSVWISYIPASLSAQGRYTVAMEIFAILASSWALVICMFLPKCFFIVFRPEMNSKENIMRKNKESTKYVK